MAIEELFKGFVAPDSSCTQIPFWFLNGPVDGHEYVRQIKEMAAHGVKQAMPHPRFGMDRRDYLTERYWDAFSALVSSAAASGFTLHLYDEFNWSSGPAGGRVTANAEHCALGLAMRAKTIDGPSTVSFDEWTAKYLGWGQRESFLSVVIAPTDASGALDLAHAACLPCPADHESIVEVPVPAGRWTAMVFYTVRTQHPSPLRQGNGGIIDYLDKDSTGEFIRLTHEEYAARYQKYFGTVIPSIFYDESGPYACGPFTWTGDFIEQFRIIKGYDLLPVLPLLFLDGGTRTEKTRCDYWDVMSHLFVERHIGQMADWCTKHGLALTGHTYEEPERWMIAGDAFRTLRRQHWAGFDSLGGYKPYHFIKPAASVSHLTSKSVTLCESLGLLGLWSCSPRMIREADNQLAIAGVTHQVPHAFFQTVENPLVECPPSFFEHNPYWKYYERISILSDRQCWMNRQGHHVADIAVFWPIVSWWGDAAGGRGEGLPWTITTRETDPGRPDRLSFEEIIDGLMAHQLDLDVLDGQALAEAKFANSAISCAAESYRVLVLPPMHTVRRSDIERAVAFCHAGGQVIVVGRWPTASMESGRRDALLGTLLADLKSHARFVAAPADLPQLIRTLVEPDVTVLEGNANDVEVSHRRTDDAEIYAIYNHAPEARRIGLSLRAEGRPEFWDIEKGMKYALPSETVEGGTRLTVPLEPFELAYIVFTRQEIPKNVLPVTRINAPTRIVPLSDPWTFLPVPQDLDHAWAAGLTEQEVSVPVFRTRMLVTQPRTSAEAALWKQWYLPDFDDHGWETVNCQREPLLYHDTGSRLFRTDIPVGAKALKLPLSIAGEYAIYFNGECQRIVLGHDTDAPGWLPLPAQHQAGVLAIEVSSMAPDFGLAGPLVFRCEPVRSELRSWHEMGLGWLSGRGLYRTEFTLSTTGKILYLNLGEVRECAEVWVNGQLVDVRLWQPYRVDITAAARPGLNKLEIVVANLIANRFAWDQLGTRGSGETLASGLLGPVTLEEYPVPVILTPGT
ncbi:MAG: glycosyl hydrolase [Victivallales bacterium]